MTAIESPGFVDECLATVKRAPYAWHRRMDLTHSSPLEAFVAWAIGAIPRLARSHKALQAELAAVKEWKAQFSKTSYGALSVERDALRTALAEANAKLAAAEAERDMREDEADALRSDLALAQDRLAEYERAFATVREIKIPVVDGKTYCVASEPGNAWDIVIKDRDEWKKRANELKGKLAAAEDEAREALNKAHWGAGW